ncbi:MAG: DNA replication and repair protein RecF, partial [Armatimonadetes bacterium]|nr:DNA replication and repair protein RecF [Armatimonadota bacterium]
RDGELVRWGAAEAVVRGEVRREAREAVTVSIGLRADGSKTVKVDGVTQKRLADAVGQINVVLFGPEELRLVDGGPGERRGYLNTCLGQTDPRYLAALGAYRNLLRQRNRLLRQGRDRYVDPDLLLAYDDQLVAEAGVVMARRATAIAELERQASAVHERLSGGREKLTIGYEANVALPGGGDEAAYAAAMGEKLIVRRDEELRRGLTVVGPHRDDLLLRINDIDARTYGSQGQQRTAALALKIAELRVVKQAVGEAPLLLLDDVLSELDEHRRAEVMALVDEADQVLLTGSQAADFDPALRARARVYRVEAGEVVG